MIVIDSDNYEASGVKTFFFSGGEPHATIPVFEEPVLFFLKARTWNDVGIGACVWDALKRQYEQQPLFAQQHYVNVCHPILFMPYSPGARQDRTDGQTPITKGLIASLFAANKGIHTFDIHSDLHAYNWRPKNRMPSDLDLKFDKNYDYIIAPDKGAVWRAKDFQQKYFPNAEVVYGNKVREFSTGKITGYMISGMDGIPDIVLKGNALVVDDICDGGATFNILAESLKDAPVTLDLWVSHGIFSKGFDQLVKNYGTIHVTDSFFREQDLDGHYIGGLKLRNAVKIHSLQPIIKKIKEYTW